MTDGQYRDGFAPTRDEFRVSWRGYDRDDVRNRIAALREQLRALTAERDAAVHHIRRQAADFAALRGEHAKLRERLDRVCRTPVETDGLSERMLHMVDLAQKEAREIVAEAETEARRRTEELDRREAELEARCAELEAEYRGLRERIAADAAAAEDEARRARREADERALRRRQDLERDFARHLAVRRDEANRAIEHRERLAREQAERILAEATARAEEMVSEATARVRTLETARREVAAELRSAREALTGALPLVEPLPDELAVDRTGRSPAPDSTPDAPEPVVVVGRPPVRGGTALPAQRVSGPTVTAAG